jgi:hypothetical protein
MASPVALLTSRFSSFGLSTRRILSCCQHRQVNCKQVNQLRVAKGVSHLDSPERAKIGSGFVHPRVFDDLDDTAVCPTDTETCEFLSAQNIDSRREGTLI